MWVRLPHHGVFARLHFHGVPEAVSRLTARSSKSLRPYRALSRCRRPLIFYAGRFLLHRHASRCSSEWRRPHDNSQCNTQGVAFGPELTSRTVIRAAFMTARLASSSAPRGCTNSTDAPMCAPGFTGLTRACWDRRLHATPVRCKMGNLRNQSCRVQNRLDMNPTLPATFLGSLCSTFGLATRSAAPSGSSALPRQPSLRWCR
jgi:hypothetical protein